MATKQTFLRSKKTTTVTAYSIMYSNGKHETKFLNKTEYSGLKRSKKWKDILTCRKIQEVTITITTKILP